MTWPMTGKERNLVSSEITYLDKVAWLAKWRVRLHFLDIFQLDIRAGATNDADLHIFWDVHDFFTCFGSFLKGNRYGNIFLDLPYSESL